MKNSVISIINFIIFLIITYLDYHASNKNNYAWYADALMPFGVVLSLTSIYFALKNEQKIKELDEKFVRLS